MADAQNDTTMETAGLLIVLIGGIAAGIWIFAPQLVIYPEYWLKFTLSIIGWPFSPQCRDALSFLMGISPSEIDKYKGVAYFGTGVWDIPYAMLGFAFMVFGIKHSGSYDRAKIKVTPQVLITHMSKDEQFPHLIPFVDVDPNQFSAIEGVMRYPDTLLNFARLHKLIPICPDCKSSVYQWEDGSWSCESQHLKINLGVGKAANYCRHKFEKLPEIQDFQFNLTHKVFMSELLHLGVLPTKIVDIPSFFEKKNPWALGIVTLCIAKLHMEGDPSEGEDATVLEIARLMAMVSDGVEEDGKHRGRGIVREKAMAELTEFCMSFITPSRLKVISPSFKNHHYGTTFLMGLMDYTREEKGVLSTSMFGHILWYDRTLFIILNNIGRPSPFIEGVASWTIHAAEKAYGQRIWKKSLEVFFIGRRGIVPLYRDELGYGDTWRGK